MKHPKNDLTFAELRELLQYDPMTGIFRMKKATQKRAVGAICNSRHNRGYIQICINSRSYLAHRLAWLYMTGAWPMELIDHYNGVRHDNRFKNLRQSNAAHNMQNKITVRSKTGFMGVRARGSRFVAGMTVNGKTVHLGSYKTAESAHMAYIAAKQIHHPHAHVVR